MRKVLWKVSRGDAAALSAFFGLTAAIYAGGVVYYSGAWLGNR